MSTRLGLRLSRGPLLPTLAARMQAGGAQACFTLGGRNDTSLALDGLRALAAQAVCIGHALNFSGAGHTYAPHIGVMLFFVLSGFVIAHTLHNKSADPGYGIAAFGIERFSRIYCAYLPALILIALVDNLMVRLGAPIPVTTLDLGVFIKNLFMLEGHPTPLGSDTYGSAGQLTSVAVEFHIYFFVGGLFFLLLGRSRWSCLAITLIAAPMALGYFLGLPGTSRGLFPLWLLGFGAFFVCRGMTIDDSMARLAGIAAIALTGYWFIQRVPGNEYDIENYPVFALAFLAIAVATQRSVVLTSWPGVRRAIRFFADYSFSLFLVHLTLMKVIFVLSPWPAGVTAAVSIVVANVFAAGFALLFEQRYRILATRLKSALSGSRATALPENQEGGGEATQART